MPSQSLRTRFLKEMAAAWRVPMSTSSATATRSRFTSCPGECWNCARTVEGQGQGAHSPPVLACIFGKRIRHSIVHACVCDAQVTVRPVDVKETYHRLFGPLPPIKLCQSL